MKIASPVVSVSLTAAIARCFTHEANLERLSFSDQDVASVEATNLSLDEVVIASCSFMEADLEKLRASDTRIDNSDFTATNCSNASFIRSAFSKNRMAGINLSRAVIKDVTFSGCKLDLANFRFSKLVRVAFVDCSLTDADFVSAELNHVTFTRCVVERTAFDHCKAFSVDLRGAQLISLSGWQSLKGVSIDTAQLMSIAPQIAQEIGLSVTDE
jgi:uncharacterized protein YjbI with pentapeptide repeats